MKVFLTIILPILAPTLIYMAYVLFVERRQATEGAAAPPPWWVTAPWPWLVLGGVGLALMVFVALVFTSGAEPGSVYTPARVEDGRVIRGTQSVPADP